MAPDSRTLALQAPSTQAILASHVEPKDDMVAERQRTTFDVQELSYVLNGGKDKVEKSHAFAKMLAATPWGDKTKRYSLSREEEYVNALKAALAIRSKMRDEGVSWDDALLMRRLLDFPGGLELHIGMFIPTILGQGTPEQQSHWMPQATRLQVIGTYAQTELGHGTFVRGLETTATFDKQSQEFLIHSPTLSSTKWWPGGLGKTCTHVVAMARLFLEGRDHGPHAFIVQIRDLDTHRPLPGVTVGDIGHKLGFGGVDNGFLSFDHVRIPRSHMLMRYAQVTPEGQYVPPPPANAKASYATMVFVRADIVRGAGAVLARAVTIATRYAAVRRQTAPKPGQRETQVLDYQNVLHTLLPLVANTYALTFMGDAMFAMYKQFEADRERGDFAILPELHVLSSGLKALCTWLTADGIEQCRRCCGGHGYSKLSGLPTLFASYVQNVTWEGENNVLCLQVARFLIKAAVASRAGGKGAKPKGSAAFIGDLESHLHSRSAAKCTACFDAPALLQSALQHATARLLAEACMAVTQGGSRPPAFEGPVWNANTVTMVRLSQAFSFQVLHATMQQRIADMEAQRLLPPPTLAVLRQLSTLLALDWVEGRMGDFLEGGHFTGAQAALLRQRSRALLAELRPNAVGLVDAFAIPDYLLNSALGREDGDVYRALFDMAQHSPLNDTQEGPAWEDVLKPAMLSKPATRSSRL